MTTIMKYDVKIESDLAGDKESLYLSVTHNGNTWTSIRICDPKAEIPLIIDVLKRYLMPTMLDSDDRVGLKKSSILGDEETFNNGIGW